MPMSFESPNLSHQAHFVCIRKWFKLLIKKKQENTSDLSYKLAVAGGVFHNLITKLRYLYVYFRYFCGVYLFAVPR